MGKIKRLIEKDPRKFKRTLLFSLIALSLCAFLFLPNVVCADGISSLLDNEMHARDLNQLIKTISHVVYVFIWPCLAIAGAALDNSLVYGSFLHLDAALWNIWNIMKNLANFALGFVFIFTIVKNLFAGSFGGSSNDPIQGAKKVIEKTLISGVLVQMSWFIVAALIDLSTILIYAVGGIPLSMLSSYDNNVADVPIMKLNVSLDDDGSSYYYSYDGHNYAGCFIVNKEGDVSQSIRVQGLTGEYIVGRDRLYMSDGTLFEPGYCALYGYLYKYKELDPNDQYLSGCYNNENKTNSAYLSCLKLALPQIQSGHASGYRDNCNFIKAYNKEYKIDNNQCVQICTGYGEIPYTGDVFSGATNGFKLKDLMEKSKGWVGPFVTMYSSILNYQELVMNPGSQSAVGNLFGFIINTFFALILFIPIAVLMVLLIIRIGFLWIVVAISPILVLANYGPLGDKIKNNNLLKKFEITEIIKQIFLPVVVVFAVSMCIVFLSTLYESKPNYDDASQTLSAFGIEKVSSSNTQGDGGDGGGSQSSEDCSNIGTNNNVSKETYSILGLVTVSINAQNYNHGKDIFAWVLLELLATGLVRFFMKFAIGMMGETGKKLMSTAEKYVTTMPLIQLPGVEGKVGLHALGIGEGNQDKIIDNLQSRVKTLTGEEAQDQALRNRFNPPDSKSEGEVSFADTIAYIQGNAGVKYDTLDTQYKDALTSAGYDGVTNFNDVASIARATEYSNLIAAGDTLSDEPSEASRYEQGALNIAIKSDANWSSRAKKMKGKCIVLKKGSGKEVYVVDEKGSYMSILTREKYEREHFKKELIAIRQNDISTENQDLLKAYVTKLEEQISEGNLEKPANFDDIKRWLGI